MRASVFYSAAFAAAASAQSSSVDAFPQTSLLAQTNSLGVVTGMFPVATSQPQQPAVVTNQPNQPAVVTSQPLPANIPAIGTGITTLILPGTGSMFNMTRTVVVSASNSTTVVLNNPGASGSAASGASGSGSRTTGASGSGSRSGSATGTGAPANSQGAAANVKIAGSVLGLGAFAAAFL